MLLRKARGAATAGFPHDTFSPSSSHPPLKYGSSTMTKGLIIFFFVAGYGFYQLFGFLAHLANI